MIGHVGRFDENKRQIDLLRAVAMLNTTQPVALIFVGEGPTLPTIAERASLQQGVHFVNRVHDVSDFLREIDILVLCSQDEGAPRVLLEAMSCGRAVVATDVGGVSEILNVRDERCGILVPPWRPDVLERELRALISDCALRARLGLLARVRVTSAFSADREALEYCRLYSTVLC